MTAAEVARAMGLNYRIVLDFVRDGKIPAVKEGAGRGRWNVDAAEFRKFKTRNEKKIRKLKAEYVRLYWGGVDPWKLQNRVPDDFAARGIVSDPRGFAEKTIYEDLMKSKRNGGKTSGIC